MKRSSTAENDGRSSGDDFPCSLNQRKKSKRENQTVQTLLSDLNSDELKIVLEYLPIGSTLMFAMTCKLFYDWTCNHVDENIAKHYSAYIVSDEKDEGSFIERKWSLTSALRFVYNIMKSIVHNAKKDERKICGF